MKKKVITLVCAVLLAVGLAGCGSSGNGLVGTWNWLGTPYYEFNADGTGGRMGEPLLWSTRGNILTVCTTPQFCEDVNSCFAPEEWRFQIRNNELTLTSTLLSDLTFTYTRGR